MPPMGLLVGGVGVGDHGQVGDEPAQPRRVEATGGLQQHRLGLDHRRSWQVPGAVGEHGGVRDGELPGRQRLCGAGQRAAVQRAGDPQALVSVGGTQPGVAAQPAGGGGGLDALFGASGAAGVHGGQLAQPLAFQPFEQPP